MRLVTKLAQSISKAAQGNQAVFFMIFMFINSNNEITPYPGRGHHNRIQLYYS